MLTTRRVQQQTVFWCEDIELEHRGNNLYVQGKWPWWFVEMSREPHVKRDKQLLAVYQDAPQLPWGGKKDGKEILKEGPHVQFANAATEMQLTQFVKRYGPVYVDALTSDDANTKVTAVQNITCLQREQQLFRGVLDLLLELSNVKSGCPHCMLYWTSILADNTGAWARQYERERNWRSQYQNGLIPVWMWRRQDSTSLCSLMISLAKAIYPNLEPKAIVDRLNADCPERPLSKRIIEAARNTGYCVVSIMLNAFPPSERFINGTLCILPQYDTTCGIRPALYNFLRMDLLKKSRVDVCANPRCSNLFIATREQQRCCGDTCRHNVRQQRYHLNNREEILAKLRQRRALIDGITLTWPIVLTGT